MLGVLYSCLSFFVDTGSLKESHIQLGLWPVSSRTLLSASPAISQACVTYRTEPSLWVLGSQAQVSHEHDIHLTNSPPLQSL